MIGAVPELEPEAVMGLTHAIADAVKRHYLSRPHTPVSIFEVLNALAMNLALIYAASDGDRRVAAEEFFERALEAQLEDLRRRPLRTPR